MKRLVGLILVSFLPLIADYIDHYKPYINLLGYTLEEATLPKIRDALGDAPIKHSGDASTSYSALCYKLPEHGITIYFESGEIGGGTDLLSFVVKKHNESKLKCGKLHGIKLDDLKVGVLSIGANSQVIKNKLPKPIKITKLGFEHSNSGKLPFTERDIKRMKVTDMKYAFWDVWTGIKVFVDSGKVAGYKVSRVTSW